MEPLSPGCMRFRGGDCDITLPMTDEFLDILGRILDAMKMQKGGETEAPPIQKEGEKEGTELEH